MKTNKKKPLKKKTPKYKVSRSKVKEDKFRHIGINNEETEENFNKLTKSIDKIFENEFGKMCPDFEPGCFQCKANLIYNKFKKELFDEFVK